MFPDSPFAVPRSSYERPVPLVLVDPCDNPDVAIYVRHEWIPYILGSLKQLVLQTTWDTQDPEALNLVQARAMLLLSCVGRSVAPVEPKIQGPEFNMPDICDVLRYGADGTLEVNCCGEWRPLPGAENAVAPGGRQPAGQSRPVAGGCKQYEVVLGAGGRWLLPFPVNDGDVVTISNSQGIWSDGAGIFWWYPNGDLYVLGHPIPTCDHKVGDQLGSACHMRLIAQIGDSTYVDAYNTTFTIPDGTGPQNLQFLANNGFPLAGGDITFHVSVCSGATPPAEEWCQVFDFTLSPYTDTWAISCGNAGPCDPIGGVYTPGVGYEANFPGNPPPNGYRWLRIESDFSDINITDVTLYFTATYGTSPDGVTIYTNDLVDGMGIAEGTITVSPHTVTVDRDSVDKLIIDAVVGNSGVGGVDPGGTFTLSRIVVTGTGTNPYGASNC